MTKTIKTLLYNVLAIIILTHTCAAKLSQAEINELYTNFESEFEKICYTPQFRQYDNKKLIKAIERNRPENITLKKLSYAKPLAAYDKAILISMVKDEEDIIFENLCWHYYMGFRKFIIIDNGSTDNTLTLINKFQELTTPSTHLTLIQDPEISYRQASRINACIKLAEILFPDILWIFPNDADEFITLDKSLEETLSCVPIDINCITSPRISYIASDDYFQHNKDDPFYKKIHRAHKGSPYSSDNPRADAKTFIRAHQGLLIQNGNHSASLMSHCPQDYISGLNYGIHIREFPLRSPEHALKKMVNLGIAQIVKRAKYSESGCPFTAVDSRYQRYLEIGDAAAMEVFKDFMTKGGYSFDEEMPIEKIIKNINPTFLALKKTT